MDNMYWSIGNRNTCLYLYDGKGRLLEKITKRLNQERQELHARKILDNFIKVYKGKTGFISARLETRRNMNSVSILPSTLKYILVCSVLDQDYNFIQKIKDNGSIFQGIEVWFSTFQIT